MGLLLQVLYQNQCRMFLAYFRGYIRNRIGCNFGWILIYSLVSRILPDSNRVFRSGSYMLSELAGKFI